ncbi:MAG: hypothetical protein JSV92_03645 [archaeon]|nr:MAG: hypothetical protein JSV92_03645 [archaeon]
MVSKINMNNRAKYEKVRHHAWAGLGFLSVFLAIRYFVEFPDYVLLPVLALLIVYILVSLVLTYRYSPGLAGEKEPSGGSLEIKKKGLDNKIEKERLKLEKKRIKAKAKAGKKSRK